MVYSPRSGVAYSLPVAKWAHVNISFVHYACVLHAKSVPASAAMIYLTCTHRARHGFTTVRTLVFAQLSFLRCFSFLCWHRCLVAGLGVFLLFSLQVWLPFSGLVYNSYSYMPLPSVFQGVQDCRLPALKPPKRFRRPPRQQLLQLHAPAICFSGRLPFARPQTPQTLPQGFKATTLTATCPCHLFFRGFQTAVCPPSNPASRQQLLQLHAPAICFSGDSRLPFARPQTPETLPQASKATTLTATCPCHLFFRGFKTAVCPASNRQTLPTLPQAFKATTLTATCPCHLFFREFKTAV